MNVFVIRNGKLELDSDAILTVSSFRKIYEDDKTKDKSTVFKYFNYIYQICDYKSLPNQEGYNDAEAHEYAVEVSELPNMYIPDSRIIQAIADYRKHNYNVLRESIKQTKKSFNTIIKVINNTRTKLEKELEKDNISDDKLAGSIEVITKLLSLSNSINNQISALSKTLGDLAKEEKEGKKLDLRGKGEYKNSMDGDPDIES